MLKDFDEYANTSKIVLSLASSLFNKGFCIIVDNLYISLELACTLFENGADIYGTLRRNKGLPLNFWQWKPQKGLGIEPMMKFCDKIFFVCFDGTIHTKKSQPRLLQCCPQYLLVNWLTQKKVDFAMKQNTVKPDATVDFSQVENSETSNKIFNFFSSDFSILTQY